MSPGILPATKEQKALRTIKQEESQWKATTGLYITNVLNHYQVVSGKGKTKEIAFTSVQRHECRAFIRGYIKGYLVALNTEIERRIAATNE